MNNPISIRAVSLGNDLRQIAPAAQRLDCAGLQLDMTIGDLSIPELSASGFREVRHVLAASNLQPDSLRLALPPDLLMDARQHDRLLWMMKKAIDASAGLGVRMCCVDLGRLPGVEGKPQQARRPLPASSLIIVPEPAPAIDEPAAAPPEELAAWTGIDLVMREIGAMADRAGIVMALSSELSSFASLERLLNGAQCPMFGVDLDPVSVQRDRWDLEHVLDAIGTVLRHVRARDGVRGSQGRTQPAAIGKGNTNWRQFSGLLAEGGYAGWVCVDTVDLPDRIAATRQAITFLRAGLT